MSDVLGDSTCMDVDVDSVEAELNAYTRVQQVPLDTDPLMWWKQHVQEFPRLARMARQHLDSSRAICGGVSSPTLQGNM